MNTLKQNAKTIFEFILKGYDEEVNILPTEDEIGKKFKISRSSVREVMSIAKVIEGVESKRGGSYRLINKEEMRKFYNQYLKN